MGFEKGSQIENTDDNKGNTRARKQAKWMKMKKNGDEEVLQWHNRVNNIKWKNNYNKNMALEKDVLPSNGWNQKNTTHLFFVLFPQNKDLCFPK